MCTMTNRNSVGHPSASLRMTCISTAKVPHPEQEQGASMCAPREVPLPSEIISRGAQGSLESPHIVPMVSRAFEIVELLRDSPPLSIKEICFRTGMPRSSVYRILRTMLAYGYVSRVGVGKFFLRRRSQLARAETRIEQIRNLLRET